MASSKVRILFLGTIVLLLTIVETKLEKHNKIPIEFLDNNNKLNWFNIQIRDADSSTPVKKARPYFNAFSKADRKVEEEKTFEKYLKEALNLDPNLPDAWLEQRLAVIRDAARPSTPTSPRSRFTRSVDTKRFKKAQTRKKFPNSKDNSSIFIHFGKQHKHDKKDTSKLIKRSVGNFNKDTKLVKELNNNKKSKKMLFRLLKSRRVPEYKAKSLKEESAGEVRVKKSKRAVVNSEYSSLGPHWGTPWWLGSTGEVALRVRVAGHAAVFRAEARATGHVALALGNDAVLAWLDDDGQPHILDCHLVGGVPIADYSQDYELVFGLRNHTHLVIEFKRPLDTCDPDDTIIGSDPIDVQWSLGGGDPRGNGWGGWLGLRPLQLLGPRPPPPPPPPTPGAPRLTGAEEYLRWDVTMKDVIIPENMATMFWCKVFRAPSLPRKHHVVGYSPSAGPAARHMVLHECAGPPPQERAAWERYAAGPGAYGPEMPAEWDACLTPVAAWAIGSKGEMFPGHVGIPLGDPNGVTYYMLEIHYENPSLQKVIDNSGVTILYTSELRQHDAGIMVTGITVSALHVLPAGQKRYHSAGYCSEPCTTEMLPEEGINVVSVLLHAHSAGSKLSLRHVRNGQELPKIAEDDKYDFKNQQSKMLLEERNVQQGDALMMECTYDTSGRPRPTLGGYSSKQEMCLSFILHYPRTPLAGCYSMTPVKEFFETFGVKEFYNIDMKQVESMFMASGSLENFPELLNNFATDKNSKDMAVQGDDQGVSLLSQLVIKEPSEFRNKTFIAHLNEIPWNEPLLTKRIEDTLYKGKHMTFCRKRDDTIAVPIEISIFPNFSEVAEDPSKQCSYKSQHNGSPTSSSYNAYSTLIATLIFTFLLTKC